MSRSDARPLRDQLRRELAQDLDVLMRLNDRMDTRATALTAVVSLLLGGMTVGVTASTTISAKMSERNLVGMGIAVVACLLLSIALTVIIVWPRAMSVNSPEGYEPVLTSPEIMASEVSAEDLALYDGVLAEIDAGRLDQYRSSYRSLKLRGRLLIWSEISLFAAMLLTGIVGLRLL